MGERSAKSLSLTAVDGILAYENIINKRRSFGKLVNEGNIRHVMNNIVSIVRRLQKEDISSFYRSWMWLLHQAYSEKVPVIQSVRHLPIILFSEKKIPASLYSKKLLEAVAPAIEGTSWDTSFSFQEDLDSRWLRGDITPVLFRNKSRSHWMIAPELETALDEVVDGQLSYEFEVDLSKQTIFGAVQEDENALWGMERKTINRLYKERPEYIAVSYVAMFFPNLFTDVVRKKYSWIDTWTKMKDIFMTPTFDDHTLQMIQLGMPALHKVFSLPYPSFNPFTNEKEEGMIKKSRLKGIARYKAK